MFGAPGIHPRHPTAHAGDLPEAWKYMLASKKTILLMGLAVVSAWSAYAALDSLRPAASDVASLPGPGPAERPRRTPSMSIDGDRTFDFGRMPFGSRGSHAWLVKNTGDTPLLLRAQSTCSCTFANVPDAKAVEHGEKEPLSLAPGESKEVEMVWKVGQAAAKDFAQELRLMTGDQDDKSVALRVEGEVHPPVMSTLKGDRITLDHAGDQVHFELYTYEQCEPLVGSVESTEPSIVEGRAEPLTEGELANLGAKGGSRVTLSLKSADGRAISTNGVVRLKLNHKLSPGYEVAFDAKVRGPVTVVPERVRMFGVDSDGASHSDVMVWLKKVAGASLQVVDVTAPLGATISPEPDPMDGSDKFRLRVTVPKGIPSGALNGVVKLKSDDPAVGEVVVPVAVLVHPRGTRERGTE